MIPLTRHIELVRQKPDHIRKQIALTVAAGITALIAFIWLGTSLATGAFAIKDRTPREPQTAAAPGGLSRLVGAASAALGSLTSPAKVEVVGDDTPPTTTAAKAAAEPTILPF